jgi:hypothetical protein
MKWVEFMQISTFVLKHRSGKSNRFLNSLSRRPTLLSTMTLEVVGMKEMKKLYKEDLDFAKAWKSSKDPCSCDKTPYLDYFIQEGFLFKNHQLFNPRGSKRENIIKELHNEGLSEHFGIDKTKSLVEKCYNRY